MRLTQTGAYLLHRLVRTFVYVDAVVIDTPLLDEAARADVGFVRTIEERLRRARAFVDYLDVQFAAFGELDTGLNWVDVSRAILRDVTEVESRLAARAR